jgi:hypothetical protein
VVLSDSKLSQKFNNDNDIDCKDDSDTDPSWKSTKEVEQLLEDSLVYIKIWCTSKMKILCTSVKDFDVHRRRFQSYFRIQKNLMFTGNGFSLNSGFTKI